MGMDGRVKPDHDDGGWCLRLKNIGSIFTFLIGLFLMPPSSHAAATRILAFGDSLTAGYGLPVADGFTSQLEQALKAKGHDVSVINAGISGDTTAGGLSRLQWSLADRPDFMILELGANDMLRGFDPAIPRGNLEKMLSIAAAAHVPVLLAGMKAAPNLGQDYGTAFDAIYPALAQKYDVPLYPFFLDGVATNPAYTLPDRLHPNSQGVAIITAKILPLVERMLPPPGH